MKRHSWAKDAISVQDESIPGVYQIDACNNCGCLMLHKYFGNNNYQKTYITSEGETNSRPECEPR